MPCGKKKKRHKIATHKRKKRLRKDRHKKNGETDDYIPLLDFMHPDIPFTGIECHIL